MPLRDVNTTRDYVKEILALSPTGLFILDSVGAAQANTQTEVAQSATLNGRYRTRRIGRDGTNNSVFLRGTNSFLSIPNSEVNDLDFIAGGEGFTISFDYEDGPQDIEKILVELTDGSRTITILRKQTRQLEVQITSGGTEVVTSNIVQNLPYGWKTLYFVFSGKSGTPEVGIYVDGELVESQAVTGFSTLFTPTSFYVGQKTDGSGSEPMQLSHFIVFPTGLTKTQIEGLYFVDVKPAGTGEVVTGGETNTASNVDLGLPNAKGIFLDKVGVNLRFKKVRGIPGDVTIEDDPTSTDGLLIKTGNYVVADEQTDIQPNTRVYHPDPSQVAKTYNVDAETFTVGEYFEVIDLDGTCAATNTNITTTHSGFPGDGTFNTLAGPYVLNTNFAGARFVYRGDNDWAVYPFA